MSPAVRPADLSKDRAQILQLLVREIDGWADESKFDWLYMDNPLGRARCWVLLSGDEIGGVSAAFPRTVCVDGRELKAWVLADFCIAPALRSLGPAMKLQQATLAAVDDGEVELCYDFPSESMAAVYRRLRVPVTGRMGRMVFLLGADEVVNRRLGTGAAAKAVTAAGNILLSARVSQLRRDPSIVVSEGRFQSVEEPGFGVASGMSVRRSVEYMDWRYRDRPDLKPAILSTPEGASVVYLITGDAARIVDFYGVADPATAMALVTEVLVRAREDGARLATLTISDDHPWVEGLSKLGFVRRDDTPFIVYGRDKTLLESTKCCLIGGDRDQW